jgi:large subunit ribosomal protein L25
MTTKVQLNAQLRSQTEAKARTVRVGGFIPAVVYGFKTENKNIKVKKHDFEKTFAIAGEFNLIDLSIDNEKPVKVIIKDIQRHSLNNNIIHIDFYQVDMSKKISTEIPLNFIGEAKAVKDLGGTLVKNMDAVKVSCLPGNLVSHIDVDISKLENLDQFIRLNDLTLPEGIELASETNEAVVGVVETKIEVEAPKPVETAPVEGETEGQEPVEETSVQEPVAEIKK